MVETNHQQEAVETHSEVFSPIPLTLEIEEPTIVRYLSQFDEQDWSEKATEAMKVGVIAIENASPTLDTRVVQEKFGELESNLRDHVKTFGKNLHDNLVVYFDEHGGTVPKQLAKLFDDNGTLDSTFDSYFHPDNGKVAVLFENHLGPSSDFAKSLDPNNSKSVIAVIEKTVKELVKAEIKELTKEFKLTNDDGCMSKLNKKLDDFFNNLSRELGVEKGKSEEAQKGHTKGIDFETDLYEYVVRWGKELGDETEMTRAIPAPNGKKKGDFVITLGEATGASGERIVIEVKDQAVKFQAAVKELGSGNKSWRC